MCDKQIKRQAELYVARAVEMMRICSLMYSDTAKTAGYEIAQHYVDMAEEEIKKLTDKIVCALVIFQCGMCGWTKVPLLLLAA